MGQSRYDSVAEEYEKIRPEYPSELFSELIETGDITKDSRLLEIGAGTGKATMALAQKGCKIDCIEIEPNMADILIRKAADFSNISVTVDNFERWNNPGKKTYDLIYSAQAFHWLDEDLKYQKCSNLLKEEGKLALFWYFSVIESTEVFDKTNAIFNKYNTGFASTGIEDCHNFFQRERKQLENTSYFNNIRQYEFESEPNEQGAEVFVERFNTTSAFASLDKEDQVSINRELIDAINSSGSKVVSRLKYTLFIVDKA